jgi:hypothetical protein
LAAGEASANRGLDDRDCEREFSYERTYAR